MFAKQSRASTQIFRYGSNYPIGRHRMTENDLKAWLDTLELSVELKVLSGIALALAKEFDDKRSTSTAAELRKTILEIKSVLGSTNVDVDPLEKLLTR